MASTSHQLFSQPRKLAICVGNSSYTSYQALPSCKKDAKDVAMLLASLGFSVVEKYDLTMSTFKNELRDIKGKKDYDVVLFFYSGHGCVIKNTGVLYLLPIDAPNSREERDIKKSLSIDYVEQELERLADSKLIFLDCCRNYLSKGNTISVEPIKISLSGSFYAFACGAGSTANTTNSANANSYFTSALLKFLKLRGKPLQAFGPLARVYLATKCREQQPWIHDNLSHALFLNPHPSHPHIVKSAHILSVLDVIPHDDETIVQAFQAIPRHDFCEPVVQLKKKQVEVFKTLDFVLKKKKQIIEDVHYLARVLKELNIKPGQRVLEIGTGFGYVTALCAFIAGPLGYIKSVECEIEMIKHAMKILRKLRFIKMAKVEISPCDIHTLEVGEKYDRIVCTGVNCSMDTIAAIKQHAKPNSIVLVAVDNKMLKIENLGQAKECFDCPVEMPLIDVFDSFTNQYKPMVLERTETPPSPSAPVHVAGEKQSFIIIGAKPAAQKNLFGEEQSDELQLLPDEETNIKDEQEDELPFVDDDILVPATPNIVPKGSATPMTARTAQKLTAEVSKPVQIEQALKKPSSPVPEVTFKQLSPPVVAKQVYEEKKNMRTISVVPRAKSPPSPTYSSNHAVQPKHTNQKIHKSFGTFLGNHDDEEEDEENFTPFGSVQPDKKKITEVLRKCKQQTQCTFSLTGRGYACQYAYHCRTCEMIHDKLICEACAAICHKGHDVVGYYSTGFCDCGYGDCPVQCKCLSKVDIPYIGVCQFVLEDMYLDKSRVKPSQVMQETQWPLLITVYLKAKSFYEVDKRTYIPATETFYDYLIMATKLLNYSSRTTKAKVMASYIISKTKTMGPLDWNFGEDDLLYEDSSQRIFLFAHEYAQKFEHKRAVYAHFQQRTQTFQPQLLKFKHSSNYMKRKDLERLLKESQ